MAEISPSFRCRMIEDMTVRNRSLANATRLTLPRYLS